MKKTFFALVATATVAAIALTGCKDKNPAYDEKADCLIVGKVITMDEGNPSAEAITVKNGMVQYVGTLDEARRYCDDKTKEINYATASIYPGFMEGHVHGMLVAERLQQLDLSALDEQQGTKMADFVAAVAQYVKDNPSKEIYKGSGWSVRDVEPTAAMLDAVCATKPIILTSGDGHSVWINTKAIEQFHIADIDNIEQYSTNYIRVDENGYPTGYISEGATNLVRAALTLTKEEYKEGLLQWQQKAFSLGITACTEAALLPNSPIIDAYQELAKSGAWKLRTYAVERIPYTKDEKQFNAALEAAFAHSMQYNSEYFKVSGIKIFVDGVVEAQTAWFLEPYANDNQYYGTPSFPDADLIAKAVAFANTNNMNAHFHTIGDAAVRTAVKGIVQAQQQTGITDARNTLSHLEIVQQEELELMSKHNIIPVVAPLWVPMDAEYYNYLKQYLGTDRLDHQLPIKSFFVKGCKVNFHTDYPVSPTFNVPQTIYAAVMRTLPEYAAFGPQNIDEAITREQALQAFTTNVAYQFKQENRLGKLKAGFVANMTVFNTNFMKDDMSAIANATLVATIVDGQEVYKK